MSVSLADPLFAVFTVARLAVVGLGAVVSYRGFRGYRRTGSRAMLAFGVAFALITANPLVALVADQVLDPRTVGYVVVASNVVLYGAAFALILYAIYRLA